MTLYVPGPVLREGKNEVVLLELEGSEDSATLGAPKRSAPDGEWWSWLYFSHTYTHIYTHVLKT
jgi:hypothetical protein